MCNERITGGLVAEREQPGLASTMWGTLNLDGAPHQIFAGIHHPGDKSVAQPKFESKPFFSKMYVCMYVCPIFLHQLGRTPGLPVCLKYGSVGFYGTLGKYLGSFFSFFRNFHFLGFLGGSKI